jgi:enterochelin esterase family protein
MRARDVLRTGLFLGWSLGLLATAVVGAAEEKKEAMSPSLLRDKLAARPSGDAAEALAQALREWFGKDNLRAGAGPKVEILEVAWAIESPGAEAAEVVSQDGNFRLPLVRLGKTDVFAGTVPLPEGTAMRWAYQVDGKPVRRPDDTPQQRNAVQLEVYTPHPDSLERSDVPKGKLTQKEPWKSKIFDGTTRDWWVYVPAQYKEDEPACVMVFQDGGGSKDFVPTVFDNLIAKKDMPVTVAVFIDPGMFTDGKRKSNRSFEYDTLSDQYARFLLEEILPEVEKTVKLRRDGESRAIAGASSGGICAWTVA